MHCPNCGEPYMITQGSGPSQVRGQPAERRLRWCVKCQKSVATVEIPAGLLDVLLAEAHAGTVEETSQKFLAYVQRVRAEAGA